MRLTFTFSFLLLFVLSGWSQSSTNFFQQKNDDLSWVSLDSESQLSAQNYFQQTFRTYGLSSPDDVRLQRTERDQRGWTHYRFQQYHRGVPVEGSVYLLHEREGQVEKANGQLMPSLEVATEPGISPDRAVELGLAYHPAEQYKWEVWGADALLQRVNNDPGATHYPEAELVIVDRIYPKSSGRMALAYKMMVYTQEPLARHLVYIDAQNGTLIQSYNTLHTHGVEGIAETRYHGTQTIHTTQRADGKYILRDSSLGVSIETYNASGSYGGYGGYGGEDFVDDDNYWDNVNAAQDEVATDAHFGAAATYDFFKSNFGRNSFDDNGSPLISYVHVGFDFVNAFWDGTAMSYGDGDGQISGPLTAIDVCGHEVAHGVTQFSAGLIYADESGALNESFSDIFGKAIEKLYTPDKFSWILGERMLLNGFRFRHMGDPFIVGDPKTYRGLNWYEGSEDGGGLHTNSGVQNYWFYALVEGDEGFTESGLPYVVPQIGLDAAMQIAYRNLTAYLTPSSNYYDAREGSLQAAADLYGYCSETYLAVASAWFAVGVGYEIREDDFVVELPEAGPLECDISELEVELLIYNNACNSLLPLGTEIPVRFQLDDDPVVEENFVIPSELGPGVRQSYTFSQPADVVGYGEHVLRVWIDWDGDVFEENDYAEYTFLNRAEQDNDFSLVSVTSNEGVCGDNDLRLVFAGAQYQGCSTLPPRDIPYIMSLKGLVEFEVQNSFFQLSPFTTIELIHDYIFSEYGFGHGTISLDFPNDSNPTNNTGRFFIGRLRDSGEGWAEDFSASGLDSAHFSILPRSETQNQILELNGNYSLATTGGTILDAADELKFTPTDDPTALLRFNNDYTTRMDVCIDVRGMNNPHLYVRLAQTNNPNVDYEQYGLAPELSTVMGVFVDRRQLDIIHNESPTSTVAFVEYEYDLNEFRNASHNFQLRGLALSRSTDANGNILLDGDNNLIDKVWIEDKINVGTRDLGQQEVALLVQPNPSEGQFTLRRKDGKALEGGQWQLFDAAGRQLGTQALPRLGEYRFGAELLPGIYFVKVVDGAETTVLKIVKQ